MEKTTYRKALRSCVQSVSVGRMKAGLQITPERLREIGEECSTFSEEYWLALTPDQQETLVSIRESRLGRDAYQVRENEKRGGIDVVMDRLRRIENKDDDLVRAAYFSIKDDKLRLKAINDLDRYRSALSSHDTSMVYEAHYRLSDVRLKGIHGCWSSPDFRSMVIRALLFNAFLAVGHYFFGLKIGGEPTIYVISLLALIYLGHIVQADFRLLETRALLQWEIEKTRRGFYGDGLRKQKALKPIFSDDEKVTGVPSVSVS